jgi:hypothetical protein
MPTTNERRKVTMSLVYKAETQEAYLEEIYDAVKLLDTSDPNFKVLKKVQTLAYEGARVWEKSSTNSEPPTRLIGPSKF